MHTCERERREMCRGPETTDTLAHRRALTAFAQPGQLVAKALVGAKAAHFRVVEIPNTHVVNAHFHVVREEA